jgi:hypothetical protein
MPHKQKSDGSLQNQPDRKTVEENKTVQATEGKETDLN